MLYWCLFAHNSTSASDPSFLLKLFLTELYALLNVIEGLLNCVTVGVTAFQRLARRDEIAILIFPNYYLTFPHDGPLLGFSLTYMNIWAFDWRFREQIDLREAA